MAYSGSQTQIFCKQFNYDVRKSGNGRWIDQKCTPDVLQVIASAVVTFLEDTDKKEFTTNDIWHSDFSQSEVRDIFKKPNTDEQQSKNEYDKFFQQPLKLFAYAGILSEVKINGKNYYSVKNYDLLEWISLSDRYALDFLNIYIEQVMRDSGMWSYFSDFFNEQTKINFDILKEKFISFCLEYTSIKKELEPKRIFTKVLNPLAYSNSTKGTERGRLSYDIVTKDMLMYNRNNFRDMYTSKPKGMSRSEYDKIRPSQTNDKVYQFQANQAKKILRMFNQEFEDGLSQYNEKEKVRENAAHMHHIFMSAVYPEISGFVENLIALSPNEHYQNAHPKNNTHIVDNFYQQQYLLIKANDIKKYEEIIPEETIYSFEKFVNVLAIGFDNEELRSIKNNYFEQVIHEINLYYSQK